MSVATVEDALSVDSARAVTERIRSSILSALDALADVEGAVLQAFNGRAWVALGYASWEAYCDGEFSETRLWSTVEERHERMRSLRDGGLSMRAIAAVLGVGKSTVAREVHEVHTAPSDVPGGTPDGDARRAVGRDGKGYAVTRASSAQVLARQVQVARLRANGESQVQVAERLGVSQATISTDEAALASMTAQLDDGARATVQAVVSGETPVDVEQLAETFGIPLASSTTPSALLVTAARAAVRDLAATVAYLRDAVVFSETWVTHADAAAAAQQVLVAPVAAALRDACQAFMRLGTAGLPEGDARRALADAALAAEWIGRWAREEAR